MKSSRYLGWGWVDHDGSVQKEVFNSPNEAIGAMSRRLGEDLSMQRLEGLGFRLAQVEIEIRPLMTLETIGT